MIIHNQCSQKTWICIFIHPHKFPSRLIKCHMMHWQCHMCEFIFAATDHLNLGLSNDIVCRQGSLKSIFEGNLV